MFNTMMQDFTSAKKEIKHGIDLLNNKENLQASSMNSMRLINHQLVKKVKESVLKLKSGAGGSVSETDALLFTRSCDVVSRNGQAMLKREWQLKLCQECWICEKSSFGIVFFNARRPVEHMEMIFDPETATFLNKTTFSDKPTLQKSSKTMKTSPQLSGSITNWGTHQMIRLNDFCK